MYTLNDIYNYGTLLDTITNSNNSYFTYQINSVPENQYLHYNIIVEDTDGYNNCYNDRQIYRDTQPPVISYSYINASYISSSYIDIYWQQPTDNYNTYSGDIQLNVYYSTSSLGTDINFIKNNATWYTYVNGNSTNMSISGLNYNTNYFIYIIARDTNGNESMYTPATFVTLNI